MGEDFTISSKINEPKSPSQSKNININLNNNLSASNDLLSFESSSNNVKEGINIQIVSTTSSNNTGFIAYFKWLELDLTHDQLTKFKEEEMKKKQDESINQLRKQWDDEERKKDEQIYLQDELEPKILVMSNFVYLLSISS